jgi:hypothetical protein
MRHRFARAAGIAVCAVTIAAATASAETQTFTTPGTQRVTLPTGVARVHVVAVGGRGGGAAGGFGAVVVADVGVLSPDVPETSPQLLVGVAGNGGIGVGGTGGGGEAGDAGLPTLAGGGGGSSTFASCFRLTDGVCAYLIQIRAAGGGGAGAGGLLGAAGAGGAAAAAGAAGTSASALTAAGGGAVGRAPNGGAGGFGSLSSDLECEGGSDGESGDRRLGGDGGLGADLSGQGDGGGGGSGTLGGGGGGGGGLCSDDTGTSGGGGGGGTSNVPPGGALTTDTIGQPYVQITYELEQPTVAISSPADSTVYEQGRPITASYTCTSPAALPRDSIASCTGTTASDDAIDTRTLGDHEFTVTATDAYGQTATQTVRYYVIDPTRQAIDRTRPVIRGLRIRPSSIDPAAAHPFATVSFRVSERARVLVGVRRVGGSASRARHRRTRQMAGHAGRNHFRLRARFGGRTLRAGAYRLTLTAVDSAGNRSRPMTARFSVVG